MISQPLVRIGAMVSVAVLLVVASGCDRDPNTLEPAQFPAIGEVFLDEFSAGLNFSAFGGSKVDALGVDTEVKYRGARSLRFTVPSVGDPSGFYAGGAFFSELGRDLTGYNVLTFYSKASMVATLGVVGFGNDNSGNSQFAAELSDVPVTTSWQKYVIPIPLPSKLGSETGLFQIAAGAANGSGYDIWFDEVQFERLGTLGPAQPSIASQEAMVTVSETLSVTGLWINFDLDGAPRGVRPSPRYFTFSSSNPSVASVDADGVINTLGLGDAVITASLGGVQAAGAVTLTVSEPPPGPAGPAPAPTFAAGDVIALFSNTYPNVPVDTWSADWDLADVSDINIGGDDVKQYSNLVFAGIEFTSQPIDASAMTHLYLDFWTHDPVDAPAVFRIKLVDFGADGGYGGGDDSEHELTLTATTVPALASDAWVRLNIPLSNFAGLVNRGHLAQLIISGDPNTVYLDNILLHK